MHKKAGKMQDKRLFVRPLKYIGPKKKKQKAAGKEIPHPF